MSTTHHYAHLRELSVDPTHTQAIREGFLREVRRRFRQLRGRIREAVGYDGDVFELAELADPEDVERFPTESGKTRAFVRWLEEALRGDVLEAIERRAVRNGEHWSATYIRAAYRRGWENTRERLRQAGVDVDEAEDVFEIGVSQQQLQDLYTRTYENLQSVAEEAAPAVRETLTQALAEGINPREMATRLTKEVRTIQRTQAEVLARTETINSYSEASLDRYERAGVDGVAVSGEFATADDARVCPICEAIESSVYAIDEMRTETFEYEPAEDEPPSLGGTYPVRPPCHPQCRCAILPVVE